jgi:hypothetical protein
VPTITAVRSPASLPERDERAAVEPVDRRAGEVEQGRHQVDEAHLPRNLPRLEPPRRRHDQRDLDDLVVERRAV